MKHTDRQKQSQQYILQGALIVFSTVTMLTIGAEVPFLPSFCRRIAVILPAIFIPAGLFGIMRWNRFCRGLCISGLILNSLAWWNTLIAAPLLMLVYGILVLPAMYYLLTAQMLPARSLTADLQLDRLYGGALALLFMAIFSPLFAYDL